MPTNSEEGTCEEVQDTMHKTGLSQFYLDKPKNATQGGEMSGFAANPHPRKFGTLQNIDRQQ